MTTVTADRHEAAARTPRGFGLLLRLLASNWTVGRLTVLLPGGVLAWDRSVAAVEVMVSPRFSRPWRKDRA